MGERERDSKERFYQVCDKMFQQSDKQSNINYCLELSLDWVPRGVLLGSGKV